MKNKHKIGDIIEIDLHRNGTIVTMQICIEYAAYCPFCGEEFYIYDRLDATDIKGMFHIVPMCREFEELDPLIFIKKVKDLVIAVDETLN